MSSESAESASVGLGGGGGGGDCSGVGREGGVAGGEGDAQSQPMVNLEYEVVVRGFEIC